MSRAGYTVWYTCSNCGAYFWIRYEFGKRAPTTIKCTECGNMTATKRLPAPRRFVWSDTSNKAPMLHTAGWMG